MKERWLKAERPPSHFRCEFCGGDEDVVAIWSGEGALPYGRWAPGRPDVVICVHCHGDALIGEVPGPNGRIPRRGAKL